MEISPQLQLLRDDVGTWDAQVTINLGPQPQRSAGKMSARMVAGHWLVTDFHNETGFEGHGVYGWDGAQGCFVATWVDSARGFLVVGSGVWDEAERALTYRYEATLKGRLMQWKEVTTRPDKDTRIFRSLMPGPEGSLQEAMRIEYRRLG